MKSHGVDLKSHGAIRHSNFPTLTSGLRAQSPDDKTFRKRPLPKESRCDTVKTLTKHNVTDCLEMS